MLYLMTRKRIFNPEGDREVDKRRIVGGNPTNIIELNNVKYRWAYDLYRTMGISNFWIPDEIAMMEDKKQYESLLSPYEKRAYELVLSFLIALDSFQVDMLKEFGRYFTAPEVVMSVTAQEFQESIHAYSYQYILESVVDPVKADEVYNYWREDEKLLERNSVIAEVYNNFIEKPTEENFIKAVFGNYVLESLNWIYEFFKFATYKEIEWGKYVTGGQILGINDILIERYIKYLCNLRLTQIGFDPLFPEITDNPMKWIDEFRKINNTKTDFFQRKPQTYSKASELKW